MEKDKLKLNVSSQFVLKNNEENIDLKLTEGVNITGGSVSGIVYDTTLLTGEVVNDATVKVFTAEGVPYAHTLTSEDGKYTIGNLPIGMYLIAATKDGYILSEDLPLTITNTIPVNVDIATIPNKEINKNIIYGILTDNITKLSLEGVEVQLYKEIEGVQTLVTSTTSISDGEYILDNIDDGDYKISYVKIGYQLLEMNITLAGGIKFLANQTLNSTVGQINNTVSGVIKDNLGNLVKNALVALYEIVDGKEILVATTYTNSIGKYMFGNIKDGEYLVKSKFSR